MKLRFIMSDIVTSSPFSQPDNTAHQPERITLGKSD